MNVSELKIFAVRKKTNFSQIAEKLGMTKQGFSYAVQHDTLKPDKLKILTELLDIEIVNGHIKPLSVENDQHQPEFKRLSEELKRTKDELKKWKEIASAQSEVLKILQNRELVSVIPPRSNVYIDYDRPDWLEKWLDESTEEENEWLKRSEIKKLIELGILRLPGTDNDKQ